jgi:C1A family cysteine protease
MFSKLVFATLAVAALGANTRPIEFYEKEFFEHMQKFNLKFDNGAEFIKRLQIFASTLDRIHAHNADTTQTWQMGVNQFTHLTFEEFLAVTKIGVNVPNLRKNPDGPTHVAKDIATLPESIDWTALGAVTPVKNQASCGSCWSFSATGALEGAHQIKTQKLVSFSEQNLVSCDKVDGACDGGWMDDAFTFTKNNGGLCTEEAYPYTSGNGKVAACDTSCTPVKEATVTKFVDIKKGDLAGLTSAVAQQPVSIAIQANQKDFQTYKSGVLTGTCGQRLDHGVLAVGYGTDNKVDFWKVKNSWGNTWGEDGYIRIERSAEDKCGVLDAASYPVL